MRIQVQYMLKIYIFIYQFSYASTVTGHHDLNKRGKTFKKR